MSAPPIPCMWDEEGEAFRPLPNFLRVVRQHYGAGEVVPLITHEERSMRSHNHFFACVAEAWKNLPEDLAAEHATPEALRKFALIQTGYRDAEQFVCKFKTEAKRLAAALTTKDDYAVIVVDGKIVTRLTAKSQSLKAMGKEVFQQSKSDVLEYLAALIGVTTQQLGSASQGAGGANNPALRAA